jgi:hypothetical protein
MRAIGKVGVHPCGLLGQGHSTGRANFCRALFRVSESGSLQVGHLLIFCLQLLQMLCLLPHNVMGGSMPSVQLETPVVPANSQTDRERSFSSDTSFLANRVIKNNRIKVTTTTTILSAS